MASTATFPVIKHVRTFVVQGVGSGGDYHNVSPAHWPGIVSSLVSAEILAGQRRALAGGQSHLDSDGPVGAVPQVENELGYQRLGFVLCRN